MVSEGGQASQREQIKAKVTLVTTAHAGGPAPGRTRDEQGLLDGQGKGTDVMKSGDRCDEVGVPGGTCGEPRPGDRSGSVSASPAEG